MATDKTVEAIDEIIAGFESLKASLRTGADKSGAKSGAAASGKVSGARGKAASADDDDETVPPARAAKGGKKKAPAVDFDSMKEVFTTLVNEKGKDAAKTVLKEFGAAKLADLEEDQFADATAAAQAAIDEDAEDDI